MTPMTHNAVSCPVSGRKALGEASAVAVGGKLHADGALGGMSCSRAQVTGLPSAAQLLQGGGKGTENGQPWVR